MLQITQWVGIGVRREQEDLPLSVVGGSREKHAHGKCRPRRLAQHSKTGNKPGGRIRRPRGGPEEAETHESDRPMASSNARQSRVNGLASERGISGGVPGVTTNRLWPPKGVRLLVDVTIGIDEARERPPSEAPLLPVEAPVGETRGPLESPFPDMAAPWLPPKDRVPWPAALAGGDRFGRMELMEKEDSGEMAICRELSTRSRSSNLVN